MGQEVQPSAMELGSLDALRSTGTEDFRDLIEEAELIKTMEQLDDDAVANVRVQLQLGHIGAYEAYGVDPRGKKPNVMQVFSPPRLTAYGKKKGLIGGVALDLTTTDENGVPWDFNKKDRREKALELLDDLQPELVLGCPPCGPYSVLQNLNKGKMDVENFRQRRLEAKNHLEFCCELYKKQMARKKFFLHEHPDLAESWEEDAIKQLAESPEVWRVKGDMCRHGMKSTDEQGEGAVKKRTGFMTNSEEVARQVALLCHNKPIDFGSALTQGVKGGGPDWKNVVRRVTIDVSNGEVVQDLKELQRADKNAIWVKFTEPKDVISFFFYKEPDSKWHRHVALMGGKAKKAEVYPEGLLQKILIGLKAEMRKKSHLSSLDFGPVNEEPYFDKAVVDNEDWDTFIDEVSGEALETSKVNAARMEELDYAKRYNVWTLAPVKECWERTGKAPIGSRWIDIDKGDANAPNYRSRLVIQEVRSAGTDAIFAATPPLESIRFLLSLQRSRKDYKVMFIDIRRAHWTANIDRLVYVRLPEEAISDEFKEPMCGRLNKAMYGCRDAARQWEAEITDFFVSVGFVPGLGSPVLFVNTLRDIKVSVHGDDVTALGRKEDLQWLKERFLERYEIKYGGMLGGDEGDVQDVMILNRWCIMVSLRQRLRQTPGMFKYLCKS